MVTIYKDKRTNKLYALNEYIQMGDKVNLVQMGGKEEKFVSPSTLKRLDFDKNTDVQVNAKNPKFANKLGMMLGYPTVF